MDDSIEPIPVRVYSLCYLMTIPPKIVIWNQLLTEIR